MVRRHQDLVTRILLGLLLLGAYVPVGYMPAEGLPFRVTLCPAAAPLPVAASAPEPPHVPRHDAMAAMPGMHAAGMAPDLTAASHRHHANGHSADCPFGTSPAGGPWSHFLAVARPEPAGFDPTPAATPVRGVRVARSHQARAPPAIV